MTGTATLYEAFASPADPIVAFFCDDSSAPEAAQLDIACRYYGLRVKTTSSELEAEPFLAANAPDSVIPILLAVQAGYLAKITPAVWQSIEILSRNKRIPIAVVGIDSGAEEAIHAALACTVQIRPTPPQTSSGFWANAAEPSESGYELRGIRFAIGTGSTARLEWAGTSPMRVLGRTGIDESSSRTSFLRIDRSGITTFLLARTASTESGARWQYNAQFFGELAPFFILLRETGGARCWHPAFQFANLTIDDPWLTEPYGCLSFPGLLQQMRQERFHATIGYIPWNYDRYSPEVAALVRTNPAYFSIAVHGNNHDRYEFFRYDARPGDLQRPKPIAEQAFNIRQAMRRMQDFEKSSGVNFDRVMVFPHGISPGPTLGLLKQNGFLATFNYHNVPLGETAPADPAHARRSAYTNWFGFPAFRRNYPHNYVDEAIAIDLFLGNPVLFMAHQDTFFDGIDAFTPVARRVNLRQPAVRWTSLGEISRGYHLLRWVDEGRCAIRMFARNTTIRNPKATPALFYISKFEPDPTQIVRITINGTEAPWAYVDDEVRCATELSPSSTANVEVHYQPLADATPVPLHRSGLRNRALRAIADFRDLILSRSFLGRLLTRKYYRPGTKRLTFSGFMARCTSYLRFRRDST